MTTQVGKWGNSLAVRIPGVYATELELKEGSQLELTRVKGGLLIHPRRTCYSLEELLSQVTKENLHGETSWGPSAGREAW